MYVVRAQQVKFEQYITHHIKDLSTILYDNNERLACEFLSSNPFLSAYAPNLEINKTFYSNLF